MRARICRKSSSRESKIASLTTKSRAEKGCTCDRQRRVKLRVLQRLDVEIPEDFTNYSGGKKP